MLSEMFSLPFDNDLCAADLLGVQCVLTYVVYTFFVFRHVFVESDGWSGLSQYKILGGRKRSYSSVPSSGKR